MTVSLKEYLGELIGTFILVLFGCGSVAVAVLYDGFGSLLEVALIWGLGVALAIFSVRNVCPAHLNPAVSIAMTLNKKLDLKKLLPYVISQLIGAFLAGIFIYFIFGPSIHIYEVANGIERGSVDSYRSAVMFGEFFPNPGFEKNIKISALAAMALEGLGTLILVFAIFRLTEKKDQMDNLTPIFIGLTVTLIICLVAPFTQAGLNPARDFGPRMVAYLSGWKLAAFPNPSYSFFSVYILGPVVGGILGGWIHRLLKGQT